MMRAKSHSFLDTGKKMIVFNSSTYDNQKMSSVYLPRLSTTLLFLSKVENSNKNIVLPQ